MKKGLTKEQFIEQAKQVHGDKYSYDKVVYTLKRNKVIITCPVHGDFEQTADNHMYYGCRKCSNDKAKVNDFIERSSIIHENYYDYSLTEYQKTDKKVKIICPIHGEFQQTPNSHLMGKGCYSCGWEKHSGSYGSVYKYNP